MKKLDIKKKKKMIEQKLFGFLNPVSRCCGCIVLSAAIVIFMVFQIILAIINIANAIELFSNEDTNDIGMGIGIILVLWGLLYVILVFTGLRARGNSNLAGDYLAWWKIYYFFQLIAFILTWSLYIYNEFMLNNTSKGGLVAGCIISILLEIVVFTHFLSVVHSWCLEITEKSRNNNLINQGYQQPAQQYQQPGQQQYQQPGQQQYQQPGQQQYQQPGQQQYQNQGYQQQQYQQPNQQYQQQYQDPGQQQYQNQGYQQQQYQQPNQQMNQQY